jgi:SNF2 family DNA or RNA helicase
MQKELINAGFEMLIVDESSKAKSPKSKITKELIKYADMVPYVYLFSGTPAPNSELEYYSQIRMLDQKLFSKSFYSFRNGYFLQSGYGGFKWKINPEKRQEFLDKLATVSSVVKKEDVLDLPGKTINIRKVFLSSKEMNAYREMETHMILELEDQESIAANSAVKCMKLREGTSGFFIDENGEIIKTGESKLNELDSLLGEIGGEQVIIWVNFHYEADQVVSFLQKAGKTVVRADGIVNQDLKNQAIEDFKSGSAQYFIGHPASVGHGITLTNCSYMVYFSLSYSFELQSQSADRIFRKGQENKCSYYYLIADGTIDEAILRAVDAKQTVTEMVFDFIKTKRNGRQYWTQQKCAYLTK